MASDFIEVVSEDAINKVKELNECLERTVELMEKLSFLGFSITALPNITSGFYQPVSYSVTTSPQPTAVWGDPHKK